MSFRLIKTSALSGVPHGYAIDGRDYVHVSVGAAPGTPSALSSVKATFDQIANSVYSNKCNTGWLSSGISDGRRMYIDGVVGITTDMPTFSAAGGREKLTVEGNTKVTGSLSATGGAYNYFANRVGIGTTAPGALLDIHGSGTVAQLESSNTQVLLQFKNSSSGDYEGIGSNGNRLSLYTDNAEKVSILTDGKVGIGTTSPNNPLTVIGMISGTGDAAFGSKHAANGTVSISGTDAILVPVGTTAQRPGSPQVGQMRYNINNTAYEGYSNGAWSSLGGLIDLDKDTYVLAESTVGADEDHLMFYTGGTKYMQLNNAGKLGLGSNIDATYALQIEQASPVLNLKATDEGGNCQIYFMTDQADDNHDHRVIKCDPDGDIHFSSYNTGAWVDQVTIKADGKVGIGDTTPSQALEVAGNITATGTSNVEGTSTASRFISDIAIGTSPIAVTSHTKCTTLNADYWDDYHFADVLNQAVRTTDFPVFQGVHVTGAYEGAHWMGYLTMGYTGTPRTDNAVGIRVASGYIQVRNHATVEPWYTLSPSSPGAVADYVGWGTVLHAGYAALCYCTIGKTNTNGTAVDHQSASCTVTRYSTGSYKIVPDRKMSGTQSVFTQLSWPNRGASDKQRSPYSMAVDNEERTDYITVHRYVYTWTTDVGAGILKPDVDTTYSSGLVDIAGGGGNEGQRGYVVIFDKTINLRSTY
tara:strand:- start:5954 stop:8047 length:2094 start_codon:yes stop_codon:yes gene_type:complete